MPHHGAECGGEILSTAAVGACDAHAESHGVSGWRLMQHAGAAVADAIIKRWAARDTLVLCGPGNNGGDGLVCAAQLRAAGWPVHVALLGQAHQLEGDARQALDAWNGPVQAAEAAQPARHALVIDALFGAGLNRPLEGDPARLVRVIREAGMPCVAIDLPSGLRGDAETDSTGLCAPAELTVTFHRRKPAHVLQPAAGLCGEVIVADIGIPDSWRASVDPLAELNAPELWREALPRPGRTTHKHARGRLAVFSGPASSTGAARLAARAGLRAGAGLVMLASPPGAVLVNAAQETAVMVKRCDRPDEFLEAMQADAAVVGPGLGLGAGPEAAERVREQVMAALATSAGLVLDADALSAFTDVPEQLFDALRADDVLTPHEGEFQRLFGELEGHKIARAEAAAERAGCVVVLKGPDSVIAAPGRLARVNTHASPDLATAGSGDVLAGLIGGLVAQGMAPFEAASAAVWLHGDAALNLGRGLVAEDLVPALQAALQRCEAARQRAASLAALQAD
ncbi:NAD(P)H-hydrate dehydratase [Maricaulis sp. CAU 1757]